MNIGRHDYSVLARVPPDECGAQSDELVLLPGWSPHLSLRNQVLDAEQFREAELPLSLRQAVTAVRLGAPARRPAREGQASLESLLAGFLPGQSGPPEWVHEALRLVFEHFPEPWSLPRIAEQVGASPAHLTTQVKRWTGRSLGQWSIQARLDYADLALKDPANTVAEVAHASGFADLAHFRRLFRRRFQHTPQEHR